MRKLFNRAFALIVLVIIVNLFFENIRINALQPSNLPQLERFSCQNVSEIPQIECETLVVLYNETDGAHWRDSQNWLITNTPCEWFGIVCENGHVYEIDLLGNNLSGNVPPELKNLSELEVLVLSCENQLTGHIPPELGQLTNLKTFFIIENDLNGNIPPELGNLHSLQRLGLSGNEFTGNIPSELGQLVNLEGLGLVSSQLTGSIPPELGNLNNLKRLYLQGNHLSGSIPTELGNLTNLEELLLQDNSLSGSIPSELGKLTQLRSLFLDNNKLTGAIPSELGNLVKLKKLTLNNNPLTGALPLSLTNIRYLGIMNLFETGLCQPYDTVFQHWLDRTEARIINRGNKIQKIDVCPPGAIPETGSSQNDWSAILLLSGTFLLILSRFVKRTC